MWAQPLCKVTNTLLMTSIPNLHLRHGCVWSRMLHMVTGDAKFCALLSRMGCTVSQTAVSTTVTGPSSSSSSSASLIPLGEVDMGDLTDSFMTLAVLAAAADGVTRIVNIAVSARSLLRVMWL